MLSVMPADATMTMDIRRCHSHDANVGQHAAFRFGARETVSPDEIPGTKQTGRDWRKQVVMAIACRRAVLSWKVGVERVNGRTVRCGRGKEHGGEVISGKKTRVPVGEDGGWTRVRRDRNHGMVCDGTGWAQWIGAANPAPFRLGWR